MSTDNQPNEPMQEPEEQVEEANQPEPTQDTSPEALAQEYLAGWQRALADYENLKRTAAEEKAAFAKFATVALIEDLLPTIDYFDAAVRQAPDLSSCDEATRKNLQNWLVGIQHVQKLLMDKLTEQGLEAVEPEGIFDPATQEAAEERASDQPEGTILEVVQRGFTLHNKLIRPARVIVSNGTNA